RRVWPALRRTGYMSLFRADLRPVVLHSRFSEIQRSKVHRVPAVAYGWLTASDRGSRLTSIFCNTRLPVSLILRPIATAYDWKGGNKPWQSQPIFSMKMSAAL